MPTTVDPHGPRMSWRMPRVLMYHNFGHPPASGDPEHLFVPVDVFRAHLELLRDGGWQALSLDQFMAVLDGAPAPRKSYLVTIDDGHESVLSTAAPILAEYGVPSVLFVPPGVLGGPVTWNPAYASEKLSSKAEIATLAGTGMEVGVHGYDHIRMLDLDAPTLHRNVVAARDEVTEMMGYTPRSFAYPYGSHDADARATLAATGYAVSFAVARERGRFAVDRIYVKGTDSLGMFRFKLSMAYRFASRVGGRTPWLRHKVRALVQLVKGGQRRDSPDQAGHRGG
ncbi:polysaccharide deacetylase family protein [Pseudonocardia acaciae]|uniref:polysaccharide deacetylase family protein n=1 Tax=Pseudonocardia acaciae TaxID=551276 RepID=UPI00048E1AA3|nr:polysaccharide deacetylase family protein [Pseudonocardia acaciae]